jgi:hypothetical protein
MSRRDGDGPAIIVEEIEGLRVHMYRNDGTRYPPSFAMTLDELREYAFSKRPDAPDFRHALVNALGRMASLVREYARETHDPRLSGRTWEMIDLTSVDGQFALLRDALEVFDAPLLAELREPERRFIAQAREAVARFYETLERNKET